MSRMTKFLKQVCLLETASRNPDGSVVLNKFGEIVYPIVPVSTSCRREKATRDVQTSNGAILKSVARYFTDVLVQPDDRLDGHVVIEVEEYTNQLGKTEGCVSYV